MPLQICISSCRICQKTKQRSAWNGEPAYRFCKICFLPTKRPRYFGCCSVSLSQPFHSSSHEEPSFGDFLGFSASVISFWHFVHLKKIFIPSFRVYFDRSKFKKCFFSVVIISIRSSSLLCLGRAWVADPKASRLG